MIIASHLLPGAREGAIHRAFGCHVDYTPVCPWPDDCTVQWGNGIIPANPFFEAFPPGTFIRGDGSTVEEAERKAFAQFTAEGHCAHQWGRHSTTRGTYLNGAGWCRKCGAFRGRMFREVVILGHMRKPLDRMEAVYLRMLDEDHEMNAHMDLVYPGERDRRRRNHRLLRLRMNLFGVEPERARA